MSAEAPDGSFASALRSASTSDFTICAPPTVRPQNRSSACRWECPCGSSRGGCGKKAKRPCRAAASAVLLPDYWPEQCSDTILTEVTRILSADAVESLEPDVA